MSLKDLNILLSNISETSELVPLFLSFFVLRKPPYQIVGWFFIIAAPLKIISMITAMLVINNMIVFHVLALVEVLVLYCFYSRIIFNKPPNVGVIIGLVLINLTNTLFNEGILDFNSTAWAIDILFLLFLGLRYMYKVYDDLEIIQLSKSPRFIINTGLMIYFSGSLFTYILGSKILSKESPDFYNNAWIIQSMANTCKNIVISYGLWLARFR